MRLLLTNDDGIHAPGLAALAEALGDLGAVTVVAPAAEQSGVGLSITYRHPILLREEHRHGRLFGYAVQGSPADCVKLGVMELCGGRDGVAGPPDVVVSGINHGANVGINVLYSGTVAGAIEGAFHGVTSVAVSSADRDPDDWGTVAADAARIVADLLATDPAVGSLWNLNLPEGRPRGVRAVPMGVRRQADRVERRLSPEGTVYYWAGMGPHASAHVTPGTDVAELAAGFATLTPLDFDLTATARLAGLRERGWPPPAAGDTP